MAGDAVGLVGAEPRRTCGGGGARRRAIALAWLRTEWIIVSCVSQVVNLVCGLDAPTLKMPDFTNAKPPSAAARAPAAPIARPKSSSGRIVFHWATAAPTQRRNCYGGGHAGGAKVHNVHGPTRAHARDGPRKLPKLAPTCARRRARTCDGGECRLCRLCWISD